MPFDGPTHRWLDLPGTAFLVLASLGVALGTVDYVRYFEQRSVATDAAWAGARVGAREVADRRLDAAREATRVGLGADGLGAKIAVAEWEHAGQRLITVEVSLPVRGLLPVLPKPSTADGSATVPVFDDATADAE
jgi:Flp pilus assembly protein TadG